jgi:hypothetical protein
MVRRAVIGTVRAPTQHVSTTVPGGCFSCKHQASSIKHQAFHCIEPCLLLCCCVTAPVLDPLSAKHCQRRLDFPADGLAWAGLGWAGRLWRFCVLLFGSERWRRVSSPVVVILWLPWRHKCCWQLGLAKPQSLLGDFMGETTCRRFATSSVVN